jgi:SAM-dependent methyltransferase
MGSFEAYSLYYDLLYKDKDTRVECDYLQNLITSHQPSGNRWLELGCGSGRHAAFLLNRGVKWQGVELSDSMASIGRSKGLNILTADLRDFSLQSAEFDVVLALFHVISYLPSNEDVLRAFQNVSRHLKMDGLFVFDVWYTPAVAAQLPEKREKFMRDARVIVIRKATPSTNWLNNTVNVHYDIEVTDHLSGLKNHFSEDHLMRHFSIPELKFFGHLSGLDLVHTEEWMSSHSPSEKTWGVCCVMKKKYE